MLSGSDGHSILAQVLWLSISSQSASDLTGEKKVEDWGVANEVLLLRLMTSEGSDNFSEDDTGVEGTNESVESSVSHTSWGGVKPMFWPAQKYTKINYKNVIKQG